MQQQTNLSLIQTLSKKEYELRFGSESQSRISLDQHLSRSQTDFLIKYIEEKEQSHLLVIYSHGNASDLGDVYFFAEKLAALYTVDIIIYDYTGYGIGKGKFDISEQKIYDDLQTVIAFAVNKLKYNLNQIVLIGFSLGSGPSIEIASRYSEIGGVVLLAPLASILLWFESHRDEIGFKEEDQFCNIKKINAIKCPIMILHGKNDTTIPIRHSRLLKQKNDNIKLIEIDSVEHNTIHDCLLRDDLEYSQDFYYFLQEVYGKTQLIHEKDKFGKEQQRRNEKLLELIYDDIEIQASKKQQRKKLKQTQSFSSLVKITPIEELSQQKSGDTQWYNCLTDNIMKNKQASQSLDENEYKFQRSSIWQGLFKCGVDDT